MGFFKPLYRQLKNDNVPPEMKAGLWMIIEATLQRNYLSAYDIYMHLAIGIADVRLVAEHVTLQG